MPQQFINNLETGAVVRGKINDNFTEVYGLATNGLDGPTGAGNVGTEDGGNVQDALDERLTPDQLAETTGGFWTSWNVALSGLPLPPGNQATGGRTFRIQDKIRLGLAAECSDDFPASVKDRYEAFESDRTDFRGFRTSWAQLASGATNGGIGIMGYAFSSDSNLDGLQLGMGGMFAAVNDNVVNQQHICSLYAVSWRLPGTGQDVIGTGTVGGEVDVVNFGNLVQVTPGNIWPTTGFTTAWQVNSGAFDPSALSSSAAITIGNNRADFLSGIVFARNSIAGITYDANGQPFDGAGSAVRMGAFQQLEWWTFPWTAPSFVISSEQLTAANAQSIKAKDDGIYFGGGSTSGLALQTLYVGGTTGGWVTVAPAFGPNPPTVSVAGATNMNLRLAPAGAGHVSFGTYVGTALAITGYIEIADAGGTPRRLAVVA